ncbi:hypothetical protein GCM10009741_24600 [Kribbella lupini]|uniref:Uncharacterized protein n=1 Tax=Kribbella lupini TaxID=291602 RepID=A0ABN2ANB8_9ACTN
MNTSLCETAPCPTRRGVQELSIALVVRPHPDVRESGFAQRRGTAQWSSSPAPRPGAPAVAPGTHPL